MIRCYDTLSMLSIRPVDDLNNHVELIKLMMVDLCCCYDANTVDGITDDDDAD